MLSSHAPGRGQTGAGRQMNRGRVMPMKKLVGQVLGSTHGGSAEGDAHGERYDRAFFEDLLRGMPSRMPLHQHHDMSLPPIGFISDFRLVPSETQPGHWNFVADVEFDESSDPPDMGGFSWSATVGVIKPDDPRGAIFLPYPLYNDQELMSGLAALDGRLAVGKWVKKGERVALFALLVSVTNLVLGPWWKKTYDEKVHPFLGQVVAGLRSKLPGTSRVELVQVVSTNYYPDPVDVHFIPDELSTAAGLAPFLIKEALVEAFRFIEDDWKLTSRPIKRIVFDFQPNTATYEPVSITYRDGGHRLFVQG